MAKKRIIIKVSVPEIVQTKGQTCTVVDFELPSKYKSYKQFEKKALRKYCPKRVKGHCSEMLFPDKCKDIRYCKRLSPYLSEINKLKPRKVA